MTACLRFCPTLNSIKAVRGITSQVPSFSTKTQQLFCPRQRPGSVDVGSYFPPKLRSLTKTIYAKLSREIKLDFVSGNFGMFVAERKYRGKDEKKQKLGSTA